MKTQKTYKISYAPRPTAGDGDRRNFAAVDQWRGESELKADDYGQASDLGENMEIKAIGLTPVEAGEVVVISH